MNGNEKKEVSKPDGNIAKKSVIDEMAVSRYTSIYVSLLLHMVECLRDKTVSVIQCHVSHLFIMYKT